MLTIHHVQRSTVLECFAEHSLREGLTLEAGAVLVVVLHVEEILQVL